MLDLRNLTITADGRTLVDDVSLMIPDHGVTVLIGPSGCGKTSVLKWLAGVVASGVTARGRLVCDGADIDVPHPAICYQPQNDTLFPWLSITQNTTLGLEVRGTPRATAMVHVAPLFASFGLAGCERMYPSQLSGGMRQRAAFLRTIVQPARFILLDEPFSALDAVTRIRLQDWLLARLRDHPRGVFMVTHDLHEAVGMADRILVMSANPGRITADIPVDIPHDQRTEVRMAPLRETLKLLLLEASVP